MEALSFLGQALLASVLIAFIFYLPGRLLMLRVIYARFDFIEHLTGSLVSGIAAATLLYWICCLTGRLWLFVPAITLLAGTELGISLRDWWRQRYQIRPESETFRDWLRTHGPILALAGACALAQAPFTLASGWISPGGMMMQAWHGHDAPWHIFNIIELTRAYPPHAAGLSGETLKNYHMFTDLMWAAVRRFAPLDPWHLYFRIAPMLAAVLTALSVFLAARAWTQSARIGYYAVLTTFFIATFGYLVPLFFGFAKYPLWDAIFWVQSPLVNVFNPPTMAAYFLIFAGVWGLVRWYQEGHWGYLIFLALVWGTLPGFKVYAGFLVLGALILAGVIHFFVFRQARELLAAAAISPVFLLVFLPPNTGAGSLVKFLPGFNLMAMLVSPERLKWMDSFNLKLLYAHAPWLVGLMAAGLLILFVVGNLGPRVVALPSMLRNLLRLRENDPVLLFMTILFFGALLGSILFVQVGMHWNTVQFFYFGVAACILPAARQLEQWWEKAHPRWQPWILAAFFLLGLPGVINSWAQVRWQLKIPADAMATLLWIKHNTKPLDRILQPLPEHILTPEGYATWKRVQQRGRMTDLAAWNAETATLASVQKKLTAKGQNGSDPGLGKDPRVLDNLVKFETELIALREQAATLQKDRAPLEQRESEMNQLRQAATGSLKTLQARLRALQAKMKAAPTPEPLVESAIEGSLPVLNESGEIETPDEAPQNDAETATSPEEEAALSAQILGLEQEITQAQGQSDTAESAYAQVVSELMPLRSAGDQLHRSIQELETKIKALESPSSKAVPAESSPVAWPRVEGWPWPDTALVASVTHRRSFLEDLVNAQIRDYPVEARLEEVKHFYYDADVVEAREFLERSRITYVILNAPMRLPFEENGVPMKKVYENASFYVYKVLNIKRW